MTLTERLYLRRVVNEDVNELFALRSNKKAMKYIHHCPTSVAHL
jgi:hypothetical protein